jgi:hypothetical protein
MKGNSNYPYNKEVTSKDSKFSQIYYLLEGGGTGPLGYMSTENNRLFDFRDYYNSDYELISDERGITWLCINPIPANNFFDAKLLLEKEQYVFEGKQNKEQIIICVKNQITINNNTLNLFKYTRVLPGKTADIHIADGSEALYLSRDRK